MPPSEPSREAELSEVVHRVQVAVLQRPVEEQLAYLKGHAMDRVPEGLRATVQSLVLFTINISEQRGERVQLKYLAAACLLLIAVPLAAFRFAGRTEGVFALGLTFVATLVWLLFGRRTLTAPQAQFVRTLTAFAGGLTAAFIPGFLNIEFSTPGGFAASAGGGLAAFLLIYLKVPAK